MTTQIHPVCNLCGGKGCEKCHDGWKCTMNELGTCNKCDMSWELGTEKRFGKSK